CRVRSTTFHFSNALNWGSAISRSAAATVRSSATSPSAAPGRPASIASIAESSCSIRSCSAMIQLRAQLLQRSPLQLFDRAVALAELRGHFTDAALLEETEDQHSALLGRQAVEAARQHRALLGDLDLVFGDLRLLPLQLARFRMVMIGDRIRRHSIKPRGKGLSLPFEFTEVRESPREDL